MLRRRYLDLTRRELEVLPLVVSGLLNKQAAAELGISEVTLQSHRRNVMRKMAAASLADLVRMAERLGIPVSHSRMSRGNRRSEERRVGHEGVSTCRSRWSPYHSKHKSVAIYHIVYKKYIHTSTIKLIQN